MSHRSVYAATADYRGGAMDPRNYVLLYEAIFLRLRDAEITTPPAILDRLMHRCIPVDFRGRSYRQKEASSRLATAEESASRSKRSCHHRSGCGHHIVVIRSSGEF
jgi:hypothetical protein